jgi:hypothetical protein
VSEGGQTSYDLSSKSFDKSLLEIPKRKATNSKYMIDNYFTKSTECDVVARKKSREKSKDKIDKENRCVNVPNSVVTSIHTESKRSKMNTKNKINDSFNYGRMGNVNKSIEKHLGKRETVLENRISRKYREKFNQSLVSKSRDKCTQRSRVNSSLTGIKKELQPPILLEDVAVTKNVKSRKQAVSIKCDTSKIIESTRVKPRRL